MQSPDTLAPAKTRTMALLLALLYGLIAGTTFAPAPLHAQSATSVESLVRQSGAVLAATSGKVAKAKRPAPEPLHPPVPLVLSRQHITYPQPLAASLAAVAAGRSSPSPFRARAPPTA